MEKPPIPFTLQTESEDVDDWAPIHEPCEPKVVWMCPSVMSVVQFYKEMSTLWRGAFTGSQLDYTSLEKWYLKTIKMIESWQNSMMGVVANEGETKVSDSHTQETVTQFSPAHTKSKSSICISPNVKPRNITLEAIESHNHKVRKMFHNWWNLYKSI